LNALLLISSNLLVDTISSSQVISLKQARTFFLLLDFACFILGGLATKGTSRYFYAKLTIYGLSLSGAFISMLPFYQITGSKTMIQFLLIFVSLAPLGLVNTCLNLQEHFTRVPTFLWAKFRRTLWLLFLILLISWFLGSIIAALNNQQVILMIAHCLVGIFGGNFQPFLDSDKVSSAPFIGLYFVSAFINVIGFPLRNGLIALFLYEVSNKLRHFSVNPPPFKVTVEHYEHLFSSYNFLDLWCKIDPKGTGMVPYHTFFNYLLHFLKAFRLYQLYLEFIIAPRSKLYGLKMTLFKQLCLPVRTARITTEGQVTTQYAITLYDIVARLFCLSLSENNDEIST
jgi:hypothetical protein